MPTAVSMASVLHIVMLPILWNKVSAIDCFDCYSFNKSDRNCGDPFHPAYGNLKKDCTQGKEGRIGEFPAKYCIKLIGNTGNDEIEMVFRGCSIDSLESQCGEFKFESVRYRGCVMSCEDNGCNTADLVNYNSLLLSVTFMTSFLAVIQSLPHLFKT